ncbi:MAG: hypothetical protein ABSE51_02415 [Terracidiphilus sp.]|jgi:hypothetical protein
MAHARIRMLLWFAMLAPTAALAAGIPDQRAASTMVSGVYSVTFNLNLASTLPAGTMITCRARIVPNQGGPNLLNQHLDAIPVETTTDVATVTGAKATCTTEIPFSWTVISAQGGLTLSYEIDAVSGSGSAPLLRNSAQQNIGAAFPASGGSAQLSINLTL